MPCADIAAMMMPEKDSALNAIGYPELSLGLNNQKLALFGLFSKAEMLKLPLTLPQFCNFDAANGNHRLVPIEQVYSIVHLKRFAAAFGLAICDGPPVETDNGWHSFIGGCNRMGQDGKRGAGYLDEFTCQFFRNLVPVIAGSPLFHRLRQAVFAGQGVNTVVQLRIEKDWAVEAEKMRAAGQPAEDDFGLTYIEIMTKIQNTIHPENLSKTIYIVCDEENLPVAKDVIREDVLRDFGISLIWKSDILTPEEIASLSLLDKSLMDFEMAVCAPIFVGFSRSTFANLANFEAFCRGMGAQPEHYIYNSLGPQLGQRADYGTEVAPAKVADRLHQRMPLLRDRTIDCLWRASITAHLSAFGDFTSVTGTIAGTRRGHLVAGLRGDGTRLIEGFSAELSWSVPGSLEYRARLSDGSWTAWLPSGAFAGARGQSSPLRGFAARLTGRVALSYECVYAGSFAGMEEIVEAADGADCSAPGDEKLEAMQIIFRPALAGLHSAPYQDTHASLAT